MSPVSRLNALASVAVLSMVIAINSQAEAVGGTGGPSTELLEAVAIGDAYLPSQSIKPTDVKLISAANLFSCDAVLRGPHVWRLAYKYREGIPTEADRPLAVGGEVLVEVDLRTKKATFLGVTE